MVDLLNVVIRGIESHDADIKPYLVLSKYMLVSLHMQIQVLLISYYDNAITDLVWYHDQSIADCLQFSASGPANSDVVNLIAPRSHSHVTDCFLVQDCLLLCCTDKLIDFNRFVNYSLIV